MQYESVKLGADVIILKRPPFEGIAVTLDFTSVTDTDPVSGKKIVKAGTPISLSGVADNTATAAGILLFDVIESNPQATILKKAYIDTAKAQTHSGVTISADVKAALPMIVFE